jgi:hypothetical protein
MTTVEANVCRVCYLIHISVLPLETPFIKRRSLYSTDWLNPTTSMCLSQAKIFIFNSIYRGFYCVHWFEVSFVCFVDGGRIVDQYKVTLSNTKKNKRSFKTERKNCFKILWQIRIKKTSLQPFSLHWFFFLEGGEGSFFFFFFFFFFHLRIYIL